jgi:hypothetical protein
MFYVIILPLIIVNIINSDKFITFKNEFIDKCIKQIEPNFMDNNSSSSHSDTSHKTTSTLRENNRVVNTGNTIDISNSDRLEICDNNSVIMSNNTIKVRDRVLQ